MGNIDMSTQKKNLLEKFNKQKFENEELNSIGMGSNSGSIILNNSYIDDGSNKK